jgi:dUTP pyrophosphatase
MDKMINDYIQKLRELERQISNDEDVDFVNGLDGVLKNLTSDIQASAYPINTSLEIKVKKLSDNAVIPSYAKDGDAGMDLTITKEIENTSFSVSYGFGIAIEIPRGYVGLIFPRSSVRNQDLILSNCVGVIDSGYRGEIQATFKKTNGLDSIKYKVGERGAQIIILPYPQIKFVESENLSETVRGVGGFGSSGQ